MNWKALILAIVSGTWLSPCVRGDAYYTFQQLSQPQGIITSQSSLYAPGTSLQTANAILDNGAGYSFGYWTLNDQRVSDPLGQAETLVTFTLTTNTTAIAWYFSTSQDANGDGIADFLQWRYYGSLTNGPASDTDGDGFTFSDELARGYSPVIADQIADGGIMIRMSDAATYRNDAQMKSYQIRSDPQGIVTLQTGYATNGTPVATPAITYGTNSGYCFGYWEVNGVRQADGAGSALPRVMLPMTNDVVAIARFFSVGDSNGNGLDDWYEWYWFGNTNQTLTSNPDGDGFSIADELARGYSPVIADQIADGGIMMRMSDAGTYRNDAQMKSYQIRSDPQGISVFQSGYVTNGTAVATPTITYGTNSGYCFGYWEVNGVRQADGAGSALPRVMLPMTNDVVAVARFFSVGDSNGNGLDDWYEWYWFGNTNQTLASNPDGDGFTIADELARGYSPVIADQIADGGIMMRLSDAATYRNAAQMKSYQIRSDPQGIVTLQTGYATNGTAVATPTITYGATSGYCFGYWEVNGVRQADGAGSALPRVMLPMTNDVVAIARFFAGGDSNGNGLEDWYEWYWFGNTNQTLTSNPDGDGFTIADELARGYSPVIADQIADGGIMMRMSDVGTVGLSYYPRVIQVLVNGVMQSGFVAMGGAQGALGIYSNSAPALGDWNGDGVPDMVVGGANGQLRFYQNSGSPIVPNFVRDTLAESVLASLWTNLSSVAPALGDWSGDGLADLAIGGTTNVITLVSSVCGFSNTTPERILSSLLVTNTTQVIPALARMPGNPRCDLYVLRDNGTVDWFPSTGVTTSPFSVTNCVRNVLGSAVPNATGLAVADMNNDGFLDVLVADTGGSIYEFRGGSNHTFAAYGPGFAGSYAGFANRLTLAAGDLYGDGDMDIIGGFAEGGLVCLKNPTKHLVISPPSMTVAASQPTVFSTLNASGQVRWSLLRNNSGGVINPATGAYQSGAAGGSMDFIEAVDAAGLRGRAYVNVIGTNELASFGKAIIVGGGRDLNDPVWLATDYIANKAYNVLRYKGYARENIHYLSFNPGRDIDGDGLTNDIAGFSSFANVSGTFTNWVGHANRLFVFLVDHGSASPGDGYFRLNTGENLTSTQLDAWLTAIQNQYHTEVVVVLDFCYAGRFLQDLAYAGTAKRVVIASTSPSELTYFLSGGYVSFSDLFLSGMMEGLDLQQAFLLARDGMAAYQNPTLDDNGDGTYQMSVDGAIAATIQIGATHLAGKDVPVIGAVAASQTLSAGTTATLWADQIQSYYPIQSVYCTILPPSFSANTNSGVPVTGVSQVELTPDASGLYQASFDGFTEAGAYRVSYYARDIWGSVSPPQQGLVIQAGFDERMVLVAGGTTSDPGWAATANMAATAYQTALARRLGKAGIRCLSAAASQDLDGDGTNDVAGASSLANLGQAITNWAGGANKLTVYLMGPSTGGLFQLNATELLNSAQLDGWLDSFQSANRSLSVVMDFDGSGSYIPSLAAPIGRERVVIASAKAGTTSVRAASGLVSFSQFFLSGLFNGESLGAAFNDARTAIRNASGRVRQTPQLDDNGNGIPDQKNVDGVLAAQRYLGAAFVTGDDAPYIGEVVPSFTLVSSSPGLLWAMDILDVTGISNVWCVITPPDYEGQGDLPQVNLPWNPATSRYEAVYTNFTQPGTYVCTFFALDNLGLMSSAKQTGVTVTDAYELDDSAAQATIFAVGDVEQHSFHSATDEDWVKFYAPTGSVFNIEATQLGTNSDLVLDLYYEQWDGTRTWVDGADNYGTGVDETESLAVDLINPLGDLLPGVYYVRVSSADTNLFGPGSEYELRIYEPTGTGGGVITIIFGGGVGVLAYIQVPITPQPAGAGWRLQGQTAYHTSPTDTETVAQGGSPVIEFKPVAGWDLPPGRAAQVTLGTTTVIPATYTRSAQLAVSPAGELGFSGFAGGPFNPGNLTCLLTNSGEGALCWAAVWTSNWVSLSATTGWLAGGAQTNITVSINTNANILAGGSYMSTIGFLNQSNGLGNTTRRVSLTVAAHPPATPVLSFNPAAGLGITGTTGATFRLEYRTSLVSGQWLPLKTNTLGPGFNLLLPWPPTNGPAAFYRAVWLP